MSVSSSASITAKLPLAEQVTHEHFNKGLIYPSFTNTCKISTHIAAKVAAKEYELGDRLTEG
ncbi:putative malate dehydrogenase (oxaloacetate-decarboxylating) (NADP(+)) [Helianthus annuus]|nr:putative malate dehydrogenase (oxaloacetate-decarboxylating) (NADP(+)) [Helianthus annuus]